MKPGINKAYINGNEVVMDWKAIGIVSPGSFRWEPRANNTADEEIKRQQKTFQPVTNHLVY